MNRPNSEVVPSVRFTGSAASAASVSPGRSARSPAFAGWAPSDASIPSAVVIGSTLLALLGGAPLASGDLEAQEREVIGYQSGQPFSAAVRAGNTIYFSGRLGLSQEVGAMEPGADRVREEVRLIMESFRELFEEAGVGFEDVVKATVYITDLQYYDALNEVYLEYFPEDAPARAAVEVSGLVAGAMVEIDFIAVDE